MLPVLLAIVLWIPATCGWGTLLRLPVSPVLSLASHGFLGLFALSIAGGMVAMAGPVSPLLSAFAFAIGWIAFLLRARTILGEEPLGAVVPLALSALSLAVLTQPVSRHYDTGLYHLQAVKWISEVGPVYGLGALHHRLGVASSWHPLAAILEVPGLGGRSAFVLGALPVVFGLAAGVAGVRAVLRDGPTARALSICTMGPAALLAVWGVGSLYADHPLLVIGQFALVLVALALDEPAERAALLPAAVALAAFAFTVKLSAVVLAAGVLALAAVCRERFAWRRPAVWVALAIALWAARGVTLTGCVGFPSTAACLDLPWTVQPAVGHELSALIQSYARSPGRAPAARWSELHPWIREHARFVWVWVVAAAAAAGVGAAVRHARAGPRSVRAVAAVSAAGALFWAWTAPDPRFGLVYLVAGPLLLLARDLHAAVANRTLSRRGLAVRGAALSALFALAGTEQFLGTVRGERFAVAGWPEFPGPRLEKVSSASGLEVNVPLAGDQCWAAPLPCTPARSGATRLRVTGYPPVFAGAERPDPE